MKKPSSKNLKEKRATKVDSKSNNKGLIGAATMLSVVSMLNYMGNETGIPAPMCSTSLDEKYSEETDGFEVFQALNHHGGHEGSSVVPEEWSVDMEFKPVYAEYDFSGDLVPTFP